MEPVDSVRVVIVEDEGLFRDMLRVALSRDPGIKVVADFPTAEASLEAIPRLKPHVAVLDIELAGEMNGVELGLLLRQQLPDLGIVVLSNHNVPGFLVSLLPEAAGGWSFLHKKSVRDIETLTRAVRGSAERLIVLDPHVVLERQPRQGGAVARLTPRQREILQLIALGFNNVAIAQTLGLTEKTVQNTINSTYLELFADEARSTLNPRVQAVLLYLRETGTPEQG